MSRKPALQKRPIARRDSRRSLNPGSAGLRLFGRPGHSHGGSRRTHKDRARPRAPLPVAFSLVLLLLLVGGGWLGWQVGRTRTELDRERQEQAVLARDYRELLARREKLLVREQIIARAASLGLYPPRPEQIRKLVAR